MKHPPLKRHPALQPFSRDHTLGLIRARDLLLWAEKTPKARRSSVERFLDAWRKEIEDHFDEEERLLPALVSPPQLARLRKEHGRIRDLAAEVGALEDHDPGAQQAFRLGSELREHIRWEERHLFPYIEKTASPEELDALLKETTEIERRRPRSMRKSTGGRFPPV